MRTGPRSVEEAGGRRKEAEIMKKVLSILAAVILTGTLAAAPAQAGQREWATAGKILTGIIGVTILGNAIANAQAYPAPVYALV